MAEVSAWQLSAARAIVVVCPQLTGAGSEGLSAETEMKMQYEIFSVEMFSSGHLRSVAWTLVAIL
ncbi:hypothetical protein I0P70_00745 [Pontibacter sp. FD36]|uniref:hypothetical protein n=1 Tax=Pontibacter sp. FD36 TaxID=2789860 RepID=UPI0018A93D1A|nr:hypothetical protein [Pontibacter sp. FD36]MBF8961756.1 hypothetical protein [Pontibacter sp. FD36]